MSNRVNRVLLLCFDVVLLAIATIFALALRENLSLDTQKILSVLPYLLTSLAVAIPIHLMLGLDRALWRYSTMPDYLRVAVAIGFTVLIATVITFTLNRMENVSRSIPILQSLLAVCLFIGARIGVRLWHVPAPNAEHIWAPPQSEADSDQHTVLIVGLTTLTVLYLRSIDELAKDRIRVAGILAHAERHAGRFVRHHQIFGTEEDLSGLIRRLAVHGVFIDRVVVTLPFNALSWRLQDQLRQFSKNSAISVEYLDERLGLNPESRGGSPSRPPRPPAFIKDGQASAFDIEALRMSTQRHFWRTKRAIDAVLAGILLLLVAPLVVVVAPLIALTIGLPIMFWQDRPGLGGKPFKLYKFRTMRPAYDFRDNLIPDDKRMNAVGRFLRAVRLDELPQLWNILIGEMSFVGPRPLLRVDQPAAFAARLLVRPGLTGWAQVMGGRQVSAVDKAALDVWYVRNASFKLDIEIFARTLPMVLFGERRSRKAIEHAWGDLRRIGLCAPLSIASASEQNDPATSANIGAEETRLVLKRDKGQHGFAR
jgi:lipopolysaccharide/colanic/teichoic acid biosynthesis glycosyltransferase